jgi:hypothetical protein
MKRRITIWAVCLIVLLAWTGLAFAQTAKPATMKTVKLSNGQEVFDISGEWDVGGGPRCLDSLMGGISSELVFGFFNFIGKHQAASAKG